MCKWISPSLYIAMPLKVTSISRAVQVLNGGMKLIITIPHHLHICGKSRTVILQAIGDLEARKFGFQILQINQGFAAISARPDGSASA